MNNPLSKLQHSILNFLYAATMDKTRKEIMKGCNVSSATCHENLLKLERLGLVESTLIKTMEIGREAYEFTISDLGVMKLNELLEEERERKYTQKIRTGANK